MNNIETKKIFWVELWEDLINNFLKSSFGLNLYNPHILIDDIITEIEENCFKNKNNNKFYYSKLSEYIKTDLIINKKLISEFKILRKNFNTKRTGLILESCKDIQEQFRKGLYFNSSLELIIEALTIDEEISVDFIRTINYLTQGIIVELIKKSYVLKDIRKFLKNIFADYSFVNDDILHTRFPHNIDIKQYNNTKGEFDRKRYNKDVIEYLHNLTIRDRISKLSYYYHKTKIKVFYIFVVEGLRGDVEVSVGDVTFYSLNNKQFLSESHSLDHEELQRDQSKEKFIQAAVSVDLLMPISSKSEAITKLENSLDLISCYFNIKTDLYLDSSNFIIVNEEGQFIHSSMSRDRRDSLMKYNDSLNLNDFGDSLKKLHKYSFLWTDSKQQNKSISKVLNALHWYKKAEYSIKQEDKMLNFWIALENLFNVGTNIKQDVLNDPNKSKFHLIQEILSSTQIFNFIYEFGWELYHYYRSMIDTPFSGNDLLPKELIKKAQLKPKVKEKIYLKNFIDSLNEIKKFEKNILILEKIKEVHNFYEDSNCTKRFIDKQISQVKDDVLMIYRFRNLIVHNAYFDNTLLPYFVWKIKDLVGGLIRRIISNYSLEKDLSEILIGFYLKKEKFLSDFDNGKVNLFKDE